MPSPDPQPPPARGHLTLLEVVLAVAILASVVVLVVLPAMREATIRRNEGEAVASLRTILAAQDAYAVRYWKPTDVTKTGSRRFFVGPGGRIRWGPYVSLRALAAISPPVLDRELAAGRKGGYSFVLTIPPPETRTFIMSDVARPLLVGEPWGGRFRVTAAPIGSGAFLQRHFYMDEEGAVRSRLGAPASSADSPVE